MYCVDAYSCFFTDSYILCEHRETQSEMKKKLPIDGIIQHVVIREMYSKKKNPEELPEEYQFDDELNLEERWYKEFSPFIVWKCQEDI
ncbi:hypothetical protein GCK72_004888 [Caenorhabditis remanei]|nr:hypothetical protein GCK72_004888 [Caenorhabditis remanei]KAF1764937.1 hypothetical protein GCK72_004888 [Caenorhabditis remanei]